MEHGSGVDVNQEINLLLHTDHVISCLVRDVGELVQSEDYSEADARSIDRMIDQIHSITQNAEASDKNRAYAYVAQQVRAMEEINSYLDERVFLQCVDQTRRVAGTIEKLILCDDLWKEAVERLYPGVLAMWRGASEIVSVHMQHRFDTAAHDFAVQVKEMADKKHITDEVLAKFLVGASDTAMKSNTYREITALLTTGGHPKLCDFSGRLYHRFQISAAGGPLAAASCRF